MSAINLRSTHQDFPIWVPFIFYVLFSGRVLFSRFCFLMFLLFVIHFLNFIYACFSEFLFHFLLVKGIYKYFSLIVVTIIPLHFFLLHFCYRYIFNNSFIFDNMATGYRLTMIIYISPNIFTWEWTKTIKMNLAQRKVGRSKNSNFATFVYYFESFFSEL